MTNRDADRIGEDAAVPLRRSLSLGLITVYGLGTILGVGIYVLIGEVAARSGMYAPLAFLLAAVIAGFTGFSYAELGARHPRSAGEAVYVARAFQRRRLSAAVGWAVVLVGTVSAATITRGFVGYLEVFVQLPDWLAMAALVASLGLLAAWGISESVWFTAVTTLAAVVGLLFVIAVAGVGPNEVAARWRELVPPIDSEAWRGIAVGSFLAFYAYIGFEDMVNVAEEIRDPERNLPRAIILALAITTLLYVLVAVVAVLALPPAELGSEAPLAQLLAHRGFGSQALIAGLSMVAVVDGALIQIIMAARVLYGMGGEALALRRFSAVHPRTRTPLFATGCVSVAVLALALWFPIAALAGATSLITLLIFAAVNLALLRLKRRDPCPVGVRVYPAWVPATGLLLCLLFVAVQLI